MSDTNDHRTEPSMGAGYQEEDEAGAMPDGHPQSEDDAQPGAAPRRPRKRKSEEWRHNLKAVFGHGIGRVSIIVVILVILVMLAMGFRSLTRAPTQNNTGEGAQVEAPSAPSAPIDIDPVTKKEADRRNAASASAAQNAQSSGNSYQPAFMPAIEPENPKPQPANDIFNTPSNQVPPSHMPVPNGSGNADAERRALDEARQRQARAYDEAVKQRDAYVTKKQEIVMKQFDKILTDNALNKLGHHTSSAYPIAVTATTSTATQAGQGASAGPSTSASSRAQRKPLIAVGNTLYAELLAEINTDDGTDAMAVIRGGEWDGAKLIGRVENKPNNVGVKFSTLAPQDGRPAMSINALALRVEDSSQGIAEDIDHHTFERYAALGASSLLTGFGKSYSQTPGTTVIAPSGTTVSTTQEPSSKQVFATTVGELGTSVSQEVRRGFDRPTTYSTPAKTGIAVFFLADVHAPN